MTLLIILKVKADLNARLKNCKTKLATLGSSRDTAQEQRECLVHIAGRSQEIVSLALSGKYGCDELFDQHPVLRLATFIVNRNETFSFAVELCGHTCDFEQIEDEKDDSDSAQKTGEALNIKIAKSVEYSREVVPHEDVEDILSEKKTLTMPIKEGIIPWLTAIHRGNRGFELGTFDPAILGQP